MKKITGKMIAVALVATAAVGANALTFSNFVITGDAGIIGTLGTDHFIKTYDCDVDITFNKAWVGDNLPLRSTTISITFLVTAGANEMITGVQLAGNALATGSGLVQVSEIVEDQNDFTNGINDGVLVTSTTSGSFNKAWTLRKPAKFIKVKKSIFLSAPNTDARDLAGIGLVEQRFIKAVPEPASIAAMGLGVLALVARRRKSK
ncbi:MAG: PEP-CTERM sorting domain-containing protein [Chthonomonas sp.]|nr:PEP-CTERM sorting domain-containing protein [Chthonomonas sp.]